MANKKKIEAEDLDIDAILKSVLKEQISKRVASADSGLIDILTFCDRYFTSFRFEEFPYLKLTLKLFYINTVGNEKLCITDEDIALLETIDNYGQGNPWLVEKARKIQSGQITKPFQYMVLCLGRRGGKALSVDSKVLTPSGFVRMGDIKVGDTVLASNGDLSKVIGVFPQGEVDLYRITMSDGSSVECCDEHLWWTYNKSDRKNGKGRRCPTTQHKYQGSAKSLKEIRNSLRYQRKDGKKERNHQIPMVNNIDFPDQEVPIDPYVLGCLLGDGYLRTHTINYSSADQDLLEEIRSLIPQELELSIISQGKAYSNPYDYIIRKKKNVKTVNSILIAINELGLNDKRSHEKFVPECYKINSKEKRIAIINGLLDTDGTVDKNRGKLSFDTASILLAKDMQFLVQSVGGTASINPKRRFYTYKGEHKKGKISYNLQIKLPKNIEPFRLKRKLNIYKEYVNTMYEPKRMIENVEYVGKKEAQCILIDHPSHLFVTDNFIVTHNTKISAMCNSYEVYKLLNMVVCPRCHEIRAVDAGQKCHICNSICQKHPQDYVKVSAQEPLRIFLAATGIEQAKDPCLKFHKENANECGLIDETSYLVEDETVYYFTEYDKQRIMRRKKSGFNVQNEKGSIIVRAVSSNSKGLHGTGLIMSNLDEFALYNKEGKETDTKILEAFLPQSITYHAVHPELGRIIMTSMPDIKQGKFWLFFDNGKMDDNFLVLQMPTWEWRTDIPKELLESSMIYEEDIEGLSFDKLFGAQFMDEGAQVYLSENIIEPAFNTSNLSRREKPISLLHRYYMHIDCAFSSCNYAYCIVHNENKINPLTGKMDNFFVEDDSGFWCPSKKTADDGIQLFEKDGQTYGVMDILQFLVERAKAYRVVSFTYDGMQSLESIAFFRKKGVPLGFLSFSGAKQAQIYDVLKMALQDRRVECCANDNHLRKELQGLRVKYGARHYSLSHSTNGLVKTKDVADCFAGACFKSVERVQKRSTRSRLVNMSPTPNKIQENDSIFKRLSGYKNELY